MCLFDLVSYILIASNEILHYMYVLKEMTEITFNKQTNKNAVSTFSRL